MFSKVLYEAAKETFVEYLNKTSLNGCYLLYYIRRRKYQRLFWFMFIVMAVTFATYVCTTILMLFLKDPTVTTLDSQKYSVFNVPFPSVAVCSNNKFSHKAFQKYALNVTLHSTNNETFEYWQHRLEILSGLYNSDSIDFEEAKKLHNDLESVFDETFKTSKILKMLAPRCEDLIVKCFWAGEIINCKEQFELKMFLDGPCCVFNYQYMKNSESLFYPNFTGSRMGLTLLLNSSTDDYFYAEDSTVGFYVKLFSTQRIPDVTMGDMEEFNVDPGEDVEVNLDLVSQVTMEDARVYSVHKRGCYFPFEHPDATFDESECLLKCKILVIESKCECLPFYAFESDLEPAVKDEVMKECSLLSLGCLEYYKKELLDSYKCSDCFPLCSYNHYNYRKTANKLKHSFRRHTNIYFLGDIAEPPHDLSLVKIFYLTESGTRYYKNVLYNWYHILSNIGGVIGICMGCSIVNGIEIIYFCCFRLFERFLKLKNNIK